MTATLTLGARDLHPAARLCLLDGPPDLASHLHRFGPAPARGRHLIAMAAAAGLTGRGGAGFPTARKLEAVATRRGPKLVIGNGTEGEPLSAKDKTLMVQAPHLVLDGLDAAADAVGASRRIICIERGNPPIYRALRAALHERNDTRTEIVATPRRYISGQETALVDYLNGGPGRPTLDRPSERGVGGRPSLVDNVETLAQLALVSRFGPEWYRSAGTPDDPGSTLVTVEGAVLRPGVYEIPKGLPLTDLFGHVGARRPRAVLVGGYFGRWLDASAVESVQLDRTSLGRYGATLGSGVIAVLDDSCCAVAELARVAAWYAASSAGQCGACTWGLRDLSTATAAVYAGNPDGAAVADIGRWSEMVKGRGACRLPDGAVAFLQSGISVFADEITDHQRGTCGRADHGVLLVPRPEEWTR
jgi:NADH:ubiquinone oxidoreductase subunit F (NADH-binding)